MCLLTLSLKDGWDVARLILRNRSPDWGYGEISFLAGDPGCAAALEVIGATEGWMTPENDAWERTMLDVLDGRAEKRLRRDFGLDGFDKDLLARLVSGIQSQYAVTRLDLELTEQIVADIHPAFVSNFASVEAFFSSGIGYGVLCDGKFVSGATSSIAS